MPGFSFLLWSFLFLLAFDLFGLCAEDYGGFVVATLSLYL